MAIDYSSRIPELKFEYDKDFRAGDLPDPQVDPVLVGAHVPLRKVGISPVDLPIIVKRRDGSSQPVQAQASLYCSLDNSNAKGLNLSRLYLLMHEKIKDRLTIDGIKDALQQLAQLQGSQDAYCKLRFKFPWTQESLRSSNDWNEKLRGYIAYDTEIEGKLINGKFKFFLGIKYVYSSTCPCSFELAHEARKKRNVAANAHSQRSVMTVKVEFSLERILWIEDLIELCRKFIPTEVQIVVKRTDEQAFAELNGANLLFAEDAVRIMYEALDQWYEQNKIRDFLVVTEHMESLHPWEAIAVCSKWNPVLVPDCLR